MAAKVAVDKALSSTHSAAHGLLLLLEARANEIECQPGDLLCRQYRDRLDRFEPDENERKEDERHEQWQLDQIRARHGNVI